MRPVDVFGAGVLASAVAGAVCALGFLLVGEFGGGALSDDALGFPMVLLVGLGIGFSYGLGAGIALGIVPAGIAANAWPQLVRSVGEDRAVPRLTGVVTIVVLLELVVVAIGGSGDLADAIPWVLGGTAVCAVIAWLHLRAAQRIARRRPHRLTEGGLS